MSVSLKTYELYTLSMGEKYLLERTTNKSEVVKRYTAMLTAGSCPRVSVDGEQLTIAKADDNFNKNVLDQKREGRKKRSKKIG